MYNVYGNKQKFVFSFSFCYLLLHSVLISVQSFIANWIGANWKKQKSTYILRTPAVLVLVPWAKSFVCVDHFRFLWNFNKIYLIFIQRIQAKTKPSKIDANNDKCLYIWCFAKGDLSDLNLPVLFSKKRSWSFHTLTIAMIIDHVWAMCEDENQADVWKVNRFGVRRSV